MTPEIQSDLYAHGVAKPFVDAIRFSTYIFIIAKKFYFNNLFLLQLIFLIYILTNYDLTRVLVTSSLLPNN